MNRGDRKASIESLEKAIRVIQPALDDSVVTSASLAEYLFCHFDLGDTLMVDGQHERAVEALRRGLRASEQRIAIAPNDFAAHNFRTAISWTLVRLLVKLGRTEEANALVDRAIALLPDFDIRDQVFPNQGGHTINNVYYLGAMLGLVGRYEEADRMFDRARSEFLQVLGEDPKPSKWHQDLGNSERHRALVRLRSGNAAGAVPAIEAAIAAFATARLGYPDDRPLAHIEIDARVTASWAYLECGDPDRAEAVAREAVAMAEPFLALEPEANMWKMILGSALARSALATEARWARDPADPSLASDGAQALVDAERALALWSSGVGPGILDDDDFGVEDASALRDRLARRVASYPEAPGRLEAQK
jgi:tetratricopeptide (TPR) repeat protein